MVTSSMTGAVDVTHCFAIAQSLLSSPFPPISLSPNYEQFVFFFIVKLASIYLWKKILFPTKVNCSAFNFVPFLIDACRAQ